MTGPTRDRACAEIREAIHSRFDVGDGASPESRLADHLATCTACREFEADLRVIRRGLASTPELELPDAVLREVWARTIDAERRPTPGFGFRWRALAAAAALVLLAIVGVWRLGIPEPEPSPQQIAEAKRQTRLVLQLTTDALRRTERASVRGVLGEEVSPALRRVPIRWAPASTKQRSGS